MEKNVLKMDEIYIELERISELVEPDFGGGSPFSKVFIMATLMLKFDLKNFVEIGVYKGKSYFPLAFVSKLLDGRSVGIDAFDNEIAKEKDVDKELEIKINNFLDSLDFEKIYNDVNKLNTQLELSASSKIIRKSSNEAAQVFVDNEFQIDILHIDGNHDTEAVRNDFNNYLQFMSDKGIVVFDDIDWESVNVFYTEIKNEYIEIYNNGLFAILFVGNKDSYSDDYQFLIQMIDYFEKLRKEDKIQFAKNQIDLYNQNLNLSTTLQAINSSKVMKIVNPLRKLLFWIRKIITKVSIKYPVLKKFKILKKKS